jgi:hypothetical protein
MMTAATIHLRNGNPPTLRSHIKRGGQQHMVDHNGALPRLIDCMPHVRALFGAFRWGRHADIAATGPQSSLDVHQLFESSGPAGADRNMSMSAMR